MLQRYLRNAASSDKRVGMTDNKGTYRPCRGRFLRPSFLQTFGARMTNRLNLKQLDAFRAVMVSGSTAEAATLLNISQPAVSRSLQNFETAVEYELFLRRNGRLVPTREAEMLFEELDQLYHSFDHISN